MPHNLAQLAFQSYFSLSIIVITYRYSKRMIKKVLPDIGKMLSDFIDKNKIAQSWWSRAQDVNYKTVTRYLKSPTMKLETLYEICQILEYNFIREIADTLPDDMPPTKPIDLAEKVAELEKRNAELTLQVATLEKALSLVGGK